MGTRCATLCESDDEEYDDMIGALIYGTSCTVTHYPGIVLMQTAIDGLGRLLSPHRRFGPESNCHSGRKPGRESSGRRLHHRCEYEEFVNRTIAHQNGMATAATTTTPTATTTYSVRSGRVSLSEHRDDGRASSSADKTRSQPSSAGTGSMQWEINGMATAATTTTPTATTTYLVRSGRVGHIRITCIPCGSRQGRPVEFPDPPLLRQEPHLLLGRFAYAGCSTSVPFCADAVG